MFALKGYDKNVRPTDPAMSYKRANKETAGNRNRRCGKSAQMQEMPFCSKTAFPAKCSPGKNTVLSSYSIFQYPRKSPASFKTSFLKSISAMMQALIS